MALSTASRDRRRGIGHLRWGNAVQILFYGEPPRLTSGPRPRPSPGWGALGALALIALGVYGGVTTFLDPTGAQKDRLVLRDFFDRVQRGVVRGGVLAVSEEELAGEPEVWASVASPELLTLAQGVEKEPSSHGVLSPILDGGVPKQDAGVPLVALLEQAQDTLQGEHTLPGTTTGLAAAGASATEVAVGETGEALVLGTGGSPASILGTGGASLVVEGAAVVDGIAATEGTGGKAADVPAELPDWSNPPRVTVQYTESLLARRTGAVYLLGKPAPELSPIAFAPGLGPVMSIAANRGKVIVIYSFQGWCPGCQTVGFPVTRELEVLFAHRTDVEFIYIQTAFEAPSINDYARLLFEKIKWGIGRTMAQDGHTQGVPTTMRLYRTAGTPWHIIIDRYGIVRYNDFTRRTDFFEPLIKQLLTY